MDLWHPPTDQPHLLEWWRPLLLASRALREARFSWLIHLDEMLLTGRVDRRDRPPIWVYKHAESRGELYLDATGQAYTFTRTPNAKAFGRFNPCALETAVWRSGMPTFVTPVFYDEPPRRVADPWLDDEPLAEEPTSDPTPRRRGHLTVIDGGRSQSLAG
jgi:hypothetical protein